MALLADLSARAVLGATWHSWPGGLKDLCCNLQQLAARRLHDLHLRIDQRPGSARLVSSQRAEIRCSRARSREATAGARLPASTAEAFTSKLVTAGVEIAMEDAAASWATFSSNGCGARSSTKKCI